MIEIENVNPGNIFLRMHPVQRIVISLVITALVFFILPSTISPLIKDMLLWDAFSLSYLVLNWVVLLKKSILQIRQTAKKDDGSVIFVFLLIVISAFASLITVLLLVVSQQKNSSQNIFYLPIAITSILLSWMMVHTIYAFHYAHMYYDDDKKNPGEDAHGLEFPGDSDPNYIDFAYFSFVIGCTFQVSDVEISSPRIRRVALVHGLLSFGLNTFVVALTINLIAGLSK